MIPSIFNDVLGPVMRGPSSSHTAGAYRIGLLLLDLVGSQIREGLFEFHPEGSLATTHRTQGSDLGIATGLLGMDITDPGMVNALETAEKRGLRLDFRVTGYEASHPNTYKCTLDDTFGNRYTAMAISTGGGMVRLVRLMDFPVDLHGDEWVVFAVFPGSMDEIQLDVVEKRLASIAGYAGSERIKDGERTALVGRYTEAPEISGLQADLERVAALVRVLRPVMPVPGPRQPLPFESLKDLLARPDFLERPAGELAREFESARSGFSVDRLDRMMNDLVAVWRSSIESGLKGTRYSDRMAGSQSPGFVQMQIAGKLIDAGPLNTMIAYSSALMEVKSSMGVVIAAPTAGAAGGMPGCLIGLADHSSLGDALVNGFWAAGLTGLFIAMDATFAAEVAGCQAETGAGAAMAAAGLVEMAGGTARQALDAASMALQNIMGLVCDPVANRVEIPCLGRNANAAANALTSANMVLGGFDAVIPFDESISAMLETGRALPASLRCTAIGGLSDTPTARRIEREINDPGYYLKSNK